MIILTISLYIATCILYARIYQDNRTHPRKIDVIAVLIWLFWPLTMFIKKLD